MVVNERISFLFIYLYLATRLMECLLKNKEPFTSAYFFSSFILHTINKNQLSFCKKTELLITQMICKKKLHICGQTLICGMQKHMKYQNRNASTLMSARRREAGPATLIKRSPDRTPSCARRTNI